MREQAPRAPTARDVRGCMFLLPELVSLCETLPSWCISLALRGHFIGAGPGIVCLAFQHAYEGPFVQAYEAQRAARDAEREAQEAAQEAEIARAAEERRRREEEEAAKWMHLFSVEAAGEEALSKEEGEVRAGGAGRPGDAPVGSKVWTLVACLLPSPHRPLPSW